MTTTPKSIGDDSLAESWVDVTVNSGRVTPVAALPTVGLINGSPMNNGNGSQGQFSAQLTEEYLRLLKEAQRESNYSSSRVSLASSRRESRCESPKSPPNSPNNELATGDEELKGIFINKDASEKEWLMSFWTASKGKAKLSLRHTKCGGKGLFSRDVMFTLFLSNLLSLLLGAGIGLWFSKRPTSVISQLSLN
ncbi:uncharacterized protein LOC110857005 [Folsomia candida]|uniref:BCL2/adenovirus E1B 19 kDa protein-interacting protein 3 n=1 Tax=Folsomia candida TaxID=158441 RepID=A0A226DJC8_FOLCA|nr:uncharacterized protein LOC110857005 [Folsomia candida]OXA45642.1 hypothetical protein Fcan01_19403 [Folsomia candida]